MQTQFREIPTGAWCKIEGKLFRKMQVNGIAAINAYNHTDCSFEYIHPFEVVHGAAPMSDTELFKGWNVLLFPDGSWRQTNHA